MGEIKCFRNQEERLMLLLSNKSKSIFIWGVFFIFIQGCSEDSAQITEEIRSLKTYPYSNPNPIPILTKDSRLYPYHSFNGYSHEGSPQDWKVVKMENDHIEVYVLPEVGGKIWGAIDKSNGEEFIYRNEVMKFRNISLRGPWTSGGIEFNFGVIGHTPATASPVDYVTRTNPDGSVSTFVGGMDLPSRAHWRVEIKLERDRANFETNTLFYNPTPSTQAYYNWMTGAAFAQDDLELVFPGNQYLKHSGIVNPWPIDEKGRNLTFYDNNRFEGHKSYHVVGQWKNYFGGYYHNEGYGFGHWAQYDEMPGQKLWLWALSRQGGIWEEFLTDTDGQYVEFQAGRQWVQYSPSDDFTPIKKVDFDPYGTDRWHESWFPVKGTGGINEASEDGVMYVEKQSGEIQINVHSFLKQNGTIKVITGRKTIFEQSLKFQPMALHSISVPHGTTDEYEVIVETLGLHFRSNRESLRLKRPFKTNPDVLAAVSKTNQLLTAGLEDLKERRYPKAKTKFETILLDEPYHNGALRGMADLYFRSGEYAKGLSAIHIVLQLNGYDEAANFMAGNLYRAMGDYTNAREAFGWAARSMEFRSASFTQMAELSLIQSQFELAKEYAHKALDFNRYNINALQTLAIAERMSGNNQEAKKHLRQLIEIDPLHHFANLEVYFLNPSKKNWGYFTKLIHNEYPDQTHLELAIAYHNRGQDEVAVQLLEKLMDTSQNPIIHLWHAYLNNDAELLNVANEISPEFVFPYRRETIQALLWGTENNYDWKWTYYLSLNLWAKDRNTEALALMNSLGERPDYSPFYIARASLKEKLGKSGISSDLKKSIELSPESWLIQLDAVRYYQHHKKWEKAYQLSLNAFMHFRNNFNVEIMHARSLLYMGRVDECLVVLESVNVLPSEMAKESRQLYKWAFLRQSIDLIKAGKVEKAISAINASKEWPENLGVGKPYQPDERIQNILLDYVKGTINSNQYLVLLQALNDEKSGQEYDSILIKGAMALIQK